MNKKSKDKNIMKWEKSQDHLMNGEDKTIEFEKLTPNGKIDISNYEAALDFALINSENRDITNIAMTGLYGSGKSSVLKTYEEKKKEQLTFLNISLAHYNGTNDLKTKNLEGKIVNQLLHQIDYKKIPQTIFKIKDNTSSKISLFYSIITISIISLVYGWFNFDQVVKVLKTVININWFDSLVTSDWFKIIWFAIMAINIFLILYKLFKIQIDKMPLKSLKIGGNQIEILEKSTESYFDKFMNDVIYLFVNSGADVIVFEDLDRFDDQTIYEKLREINTLANKRRETIKNCNKLSFLYLIKDDMFKSKDRTKFFDFIIPIVPVMDGSNSYQKFLDVFERLDVKDDFEERLLKKLALYIDDYRLLKNIANEYRIYKGRIGSSGLTLNWNKLFALIIYKNIFPNDFSALQYGKSFLNTIFDQKYKLLDKETLKIDSELKKVQKDIENAQAEALTDINELDALYLDYSTDYEILINEKHLGQFNSKGEFVAAIKANNFKVEKYTAKTSYYDSSITYEIVDYDIRKDFESLNNNEDYAIRRKNLQNKSSSNNKKLLDIQKHLKSQLEKLRSTSIKNLLSDKDITFFKEIANNNYSEEDSDNNHDFTYLIESDYFDLLVLLIREELIDEKYSDYMTYFYEGELSLNDKRFVREILDNIKPDIHYKPEDFAKILSNITVEEFKRYHIKNIMLSSLILINRKEYAEYCNVLINDLKENGEVEFIYQVYETFKFKALDFFETINEKWPELVINVINTDTLNGEEKLSFIIDYLTESDYDIISSLIDLDQLNYYIGQSKLLSSPAMLKGNMSKKLSDLKKLGVEFKNLHNDYIPKEVVQEITKLEAFVISRENIEVILKAYDKEICTEDFEASNYSSIVELNEKDINNTLFGKRFNQYLTIYLGFGNKTLKDNYEDVINILNSEHIRKDIKHQYIERLSLSQNIPSISNVKDKELWGTLVKNEIVEATSMNASLLFEYNDWKLSENLISFINSSDVPIIFNGNGLDADVPLQIFNEIVINESLISEQYISILRNLNIFYRNSIPEYIPIKRMELLISNHIIKFTNETLNSIRTNHRNKLKQFILEYFDEYIVIIDDDEYFDNDELVELVQSDEFSLHQSKIIINKMQFPLSIKAFNYKDSIKRYILENNFDRNDLSYLLVEYSQLGKKLKKVVYQIIIKEENLERIIRKTLPIELKLLDEILSDTLVQLDYKQHIFAANILKFNSLEVINRIPKLSLPEEFIEVLNRKKVRVDNTDLNMKIAEQYKIKEWVTRIEYTDNLLIIQGKKIIRRLSELY